MYFSDQFILLNKMHSFLKHNKTTLYSIIMCLLLVNYFTLEIKNALYFFMIKLACTKDLKCLEIHYTTR